MSTKPASRLLGPHRSKSLPVRTPAKANRDNAQVFHPSQRLIAEFASEFDAVPRVETADASNVQVDSDVNQWAYIPSCLPWPQTLPCAEFFRQMTLRTWKQAKPAAAAGGVSPESLTMRGPDGATGMAVGSHRGMGADQLPDQSVPSLPGGYPSNWDAIPELQRVSAYCFRGDKRQPRAIKLADGFHPPNTRTDRAYASVVARRFAGYMKAHLQQDVNQAEIEEYIQGEGHAGQVFVQHEIWREILRGEEMHLGRMLRDDFLRGYVSTSRSVPLAASFADRASADEFRSDHHGVYAMHSEGGFLVPKKKTQADATLGEAEIAHPGSLPWSKVVAFRLPAVYRIEKKRKRKVTSKYRCDPIVLVRKGFREADPTGAREVILALSAFV